MSETNPYAAPEGFVPNPTDVYGTWDTTNTGGTSRIEDTTPIFDIAKVQDAKVALKALDPEDPTPRSLVVGPVVPAAPALVETDPSEAARERLEAIASTETVTAPSGAEIPVTEPVTAEPDAAGADAPVTGPAEPTTPDAPAAEPVVPQDPSGVNDGDGTDLEPGEHGDYDPGAHSIAEVKAHLATADDAEKQRVLAAEEAGLARKGLLSA